MKGKIDLKKVIVKNVNMFIFYTWIPARAAVPHADISTFSGRSTGSPKFKTYIFQVYFNGVRHVVSSAVV